MLQSSFAENLNDDIVLYEKYRLQRKRDKKNKLLYYHFVPDDAIQLGNLHKFYKHVPMFIDSGKNNRICRPRFPNHKKTMMTYHNILHDQVEAFVLSGTVRILPKCKKGNVQMPIMLVNQLVKPRWCHDGGLSKCLELFPTPVKMESFDDIFRLI